MFENVVVEEGKANPKISYDVKKEVKVPIKIDCFADLSKFPKRLKGEEVSFKDSFVFNNDLRQLLQKEQDYVNDIVSKYYDSIVQQLSMLSNDNVLEIFFNPKMVKALSIAKQSQNLGINQLVFMNQMIYNYFVYDKRDRDIMNLLYELARIINSKTVSILTGIGLPIKQAIYLSLCRYSAFDEIAASQRVNYVMSTFSPILMTPQTIINIYERLYDKLGDLFKATMIDNSQELGDDPRSDQINEIRGNITLAVLTLIENMPINAIYNVLVGYAQMVASIINTQGGFNPRCLLRSLSGDFSRINQVLAMLLQSGYYIP